MTGAEGEEVGEASLEVFSRRCARASRGCGWGVLLLGAAALVAWHLHWTAFLQILPSLPPVKYNTALGFVLAGAGLLLLGARGGAAGWLGGGAALIGALTAAEYLTQRDFGFDQLFFRSYIDTATAYAGRMSPLSATCFVLAGGALVAAAPGRPSKMGLMVAGVFACAVAMVAAIALAGYVLGIDVASGWGAYTRMAVDTAAAFLLLGAGLLAWAWQASRRLGVDFLQWLLVTGSTTLIAMIGFVSTVGFTRLKSTDVRREHSYEVLSEMEEFLGDLFDVQRGLQDYIVTRHAASLAPYRHGAADAETRLARLAELTVGEPASHQRLLAMAADLQGALDDARQLIDLREAKGLPAAARLESTEQDFTAVNRTLDDLQAFANDERRLMGARPAVETDFHGMVHLMVFSGALATALLVMANLVTGREVARRRRLEGEQRELARRAVAGERAKSEFLAVMSHEIRTPMNGVVGMASILGDTELTEFQRDCLNTIQTSGESLLAVINDILDFSKMESGRMTLESVAFSLPECLEEAFDLFSAQIRAKRLEALYQVDPAVPSRLVGDPTRLRQVLINLIGNAIKFTAQGEIVVNVRPAPASSGGAGTRALLFSVTDTGIGIPPEGIGRLFQAFQQADAATTRRYGGSGLGLAISKRLAELMGGTMWVESRPGAGSTFFFTATLKEASGPAPQAPAGGSLSARAVLVVDDNATNRRIMEARLSAWGMVPTAVASPEEALRLLAAQEFAVGLLDLQMPEMDGISLAREIRRRSAMPLVLLSSSGEPVGGEEAALFQSQVPKPIKHSALFNALQRAVGVVPAPVPGGEKRFDGGMAAGHPLRILLAEDNSVNQKVGVRMLARLGYSAALATNGLEVLRAMETAEYDLIFMDVQMPELGGVETVRILREKFPDDRPRIVALTAEALEGDRERFLALGFDGYLSKPLQPSHLQEVLRAVPSRLRAAA